VLVRLWRLLRKAGEGVNEGREPTTSWEDRRRDATNQLIVTHFNSDNGKKGWKKTGDNLCAGCYLVGLASILSGAGRKKIKNQGEP